MEFRLLRDGEVSQGVHRVEAVAGDGEVVARYECPCGLCAAWREFLPTMERYLFEHETPRRPDWLGA